MLLYFHVSTTGKLLHVVDELFFTFQCHFEIATQFLQCLVTFLSILFHDLVEYSPIRRVQGKEWNTVVAVLAFAYIATVVVVLVVVVVAVVVVVLVVLVDGQRR